MRIIEGLILSDLQLAVSIAGRYPIQFVHAAGRIGNSSLLPYIKKLAKDNMDDLEFVDLYIWALGKLKARKNIVELAEKLGIKCSIY
jgi:hypothetical protein